MALSNTLLNVAADAIKAELDFAGLLNTTTTELTGGSPAYARRALTFGSSSSGDASATAVTFDVPAGSTVNTVGFYAASTGGVAVYTQAVTAETYGGQGTYGLTVSVDVD